MPKVNVHSINQLQKQSPTQIIELVSEFRLNQRSLTTSVEKLTAIVDLLQKPRNRIDNVGKASTAIKYFTVD